MHEIENLPPNASYFFYPLDFERRGGPPKPLAVLAAQMTIRPAGPPSVAGAKPVGAGQAGRQVLGAMPCGCHERLVWKRKGVKRGCRVGGG